MPDTKNTMEMALIGENGALHQLAERDKDFAAAITLYGSPPDRTMPQGFTSLIRIIIGQQISRQAATAVWQKLVKAKLDHATHITNAGVDALKANGLSQQKAEYIHGIASQVTSGALDFDHLANASGDEVASILTSLRGVGDWTADNYRLFALLDMDAWPYNDLALQEGVKILKSLDSRPDAKTMQIMAMDWQPYRGAAALMLWHIYAQHKKDASPAAI